MSINYTLAEAEKIMQQKLRAKLMLLGVSLVAPETVFLTTSVNGNDCGNFYINYSIFFNLN